MNRVSSRLAAHAGTRQVEAVLKSDLVADAAERAVHAVWRQALRLIKQGNGWSTYQQARHLFAQLLPTVETATAAALRRAAFWGHRSARAALKTVLPLSIVQAAAIDRTVSGPPQRRRYREGMAANVREGPANRLWEDLPGGFTFGDLLNPWRDWQDNQGDGDEEPTLANGYNGLFDMLFLPPTEELLDEVIFSSGWRQRLRANTRLGNPDTLAHILASGLAIGKSQQQIAADLLPHVDGVRASARRLARTESMRVAGAMQMDCHDQLGDLRVGYTLVATLDSHSRPWHAARNGEIYYLNPQDGQKGPFQMPNPPEEPSDPRERPPGKPKVAYNCRCTLSVVLRDPGSIARDHPVFTNSRGNLVPDPIDYSQWFERTDDKRRKIAVGSARYHAVADQLGRTPSWAHFLSASTGNLLSKDYLERESPRQRAERLRKLEQRFSRQRQQTRDVTTFGFLHGVT